MNRQHVKWLKSCTARQDYPITPDLLFAFLNRRYVQRADARQKAMGLQYTTAEAHDLALELADFIQDQLPPDRNADE